MLAGTSIFQRICFNLLATLLLLPTTIYCHDDRNHQQFEVHIELNEENDNEQKLPVFSSLATFRAIGHYRWQRCCQYGMCQCPGYVWPTYHRPQRQYDLYPQVQSPGHGGQRWPGYGGSGHFQGGLQPTYPYPASSGYHHVLPFGQISPYGQQQHGQSGGQSWDDDAQDTEFAASALSVQGLEAFDGPLVEEELPPAAADQSQGQRPARSPRDGGHQSGQKQPRTRRQRRLTANRQKTGVDKRRQNNRKSGDGGSSSSGSGSNGGNMKGTRTTRATARPPPPPRMTKVPMRVPNPGGNRNKNKDSG